MVKAAMPIVVSDKQRAVQESIVRSQTIDARTARRACIVVLAGECMRNREIARQLGIDRIQAACWRSGRKLRIDAAEMVRITTQTKLEGSNHWSTRKLAAKLGISDTTVLRE